MLQSPLSKVFVDDLHSSIDLKTTDFRELIGPHGFRSTGEFADYLNE
jgi:hypothetical protein